MGDGTEEDPELLALKASLLDTSAGGSGSSTTSHIAALVALTKTVDQVIAVHTQSDDVFTSFLSFRLGQ